MARDGNMTIYVEAVHTVTKYSRELIERTIADAEKGMPPVKFPGSMIWEIWQAYQAIKEYERLTDG